MGTSTLSRRLFGGALATLPALPAFLGAPQASAQPATTTEGARPTGEAGFSFVAYGDSRPMMYLPVRSGQPDFVRLMTEMFGLVMPERMAEAVAQRTVRPTYDPATGELIQIVMPFESRSEVMTLTLHQGWVTEASVEDTRLLPGVRRTIFRLQGGDWVSHEVVRNIRTERARFAINAGDVVWWGNQGRTVTESPYWKRVNDTVLSQLPPPDAEMRAAGLEGRWYIGVGNHEVWGDPRIDGVLSAMPYLRPLGVTPDRLIYKFDFRDSRFIFLWSGRYDYRSPSLWDADRPIYAEQVRQMQQWLDEAKTQGLRRAFITFHNPVFARSGLGAIPAPDNPHRVIASYARDLDVVVFNGHVHTTEIYDVDGVKYLMLGGGGAEQDPILPGRTSIRVPPDYPPDLYWKGQPPQEEYNYCLVDVEPGQKIRFTLNRLRPWSSEPFGTVALFA